MFKAVIQLNSDFIFVPIGMYYLEYKHGISGKRFRAPEFDPCLNNLLQELLSPHRGGRSVSHLMLGQDDNSPS